MQHYNPLTDDQVKEGFGIPDGWDLRAQLDFGSIEAPAGEKKFMNDDDRFKVLKQSNRPLDCPK